MRRAFSASVFARHAGRVLLVRHRRLGTWLPVGGEVEAGETPLEAARRELREETGLDGSFPDVAGITGSPPGLLGYEEHMAGQKGLHLNFCFLADVDTDLVTPNEEFDEHRWVGADVPVECPANVRELVAQALGVPPLVALARTWLRRFNDRDLDGLLALYADDAVHTSPKLRDRHPETRGEVRGIAALRSWWRDSMDRLPGLHYEEISVTADARTVYLLYTRQNPGDADLIVAESFEVDGGRIVASHVFHG